jgi:hypothetical protein
MRADGSHRTYAIDADGIEQARSWLAWLVEPRDVFDQPLDALETEVARGKRERRRGVARSASRVRKGGRVA